MSDSKKIKPALSKGTRDFLPAEVARRNYIFSTIKSVFRNYGFEEIETPAIERLETLTGKYGEEGDKLLFKILNSGNYLDAVDKYLHTKGNLAERVTAITQIVTSAALTPLISEKGLRYDLTVPLARYVVQNQDNLAFPFKRFHVGPVWRADKPQKGRYQEFYQCDADIIGSNSLYNEVELTKIYYEVFTKLGINVVIKINNRKILQGIAAYYNCLDKFEIFVAILDKLDKVGYSNIVEEFKRNDINVEPEDMYPLSFFWTGAEQNSKSWGELHNYLKDLFTRTNYNSALIGIDELMHLVRYFDFKSNVRFDCSLTRGLNYYTGTIWEVVLDQNIYQGKVTMGSLGGGGRYDNLTEMFGGQNMSGVGISFGIERIYDVMEELNLFPATISQGVKVLFVPRDISVEEFTFQQVSTLREKGIPAEIFLGNVKKQKQFDYVERKNIAYLVEIGDNEKNTGLFRLRNAQTRETRNDLTISDIIDLIAAG